MKRIIFFLATLLISFLSLAQRKSSSDVYVNGYTRSNGTYVQPHYRTAPNSTTTDNFSERGNINPYTGKIGTKNSIDNLNLTNPNSYNSTNHNTNKSITNFNNNYSENNNTIIKSDEHENMFDELLRSSKREMKELIEEFAKSQGGLEAIKFNSKYSYDIRLSVNYLLDKLGYEIVDENEKIDGNIDAKTVLAIMLFQSEHGLNTDGKIGPSTSRILQIEAKKLLD